jgi:thiol-disulfide isomerase/thioredoxin
MRIVAALLLVAVLVAPSAQTQEPGKIDVKVVSYDALKELILKNRGKVVVVDFWSTSCGPCIRNFPHMVRMQREFGKDGLASITVSFDKIDDFTKTEQELKERVLNKLKLLNSSFVNVILDKGWDLAKEKLRIEAIPSIFVFSRQGKWALFGGDGKGVDAAAVEKLVVQLLQEK